jgi:H+/Cl- antiporter ClcA
MAGLVTFGYAGLHAAAWNIPLATHIEQLLWRVSSVVMLGCCVAWFGMDHIQGYKIRRRQRREGIDDYDALIPWWRVPASIAVAIAYGLCRMYVLIESFLALRWMPISTYQQVDWGKWVPHI